jgi:hypothetical protein
METRVISVCKKTKRSKWQNNQPKNTNEGMQMIVEISGTGSKRTSVTKFIPGNS